MSGLSTVLHKTVFSIPLKTIETCNHPPREGISTEEDLLKREIEDLPVVAELNMKVCVLAKVNVHNSTVHTNVPFRNRPSHSPKTLHVVPFLQQHFSGFSSSLESQNLSFQYHVRVIR